MGKIKLNNNICIATAFYYPHVGGIEVFTKRLAEELVKKGYGVIILTHKENNSDSSITNISKNIKIIRLDCHKLLNGRFPIVKKSKNNRKLINYIKSEKPYNFLINTRFYYLSQFTAKIANELDKVPVLLDHGSQHLTLGNRFLDVFVRHVEHRMTNKLKNYKIKYYGISLKSSKWLKHFGIKPKGEIPNAINTKEFTSNKTDYSLFKKYNIPKNAFIVYFVGRYFLEKGILNLLSCAKKLSKKNIYFVFTGSGKLEKEISKNQTNKIINTGYLKIEDISSIMQQASVLCLPTRSEGFCTTLLESSSCKLPAIITNVGGTDELILDNNYGYIINNSSVEEITHAILELYNKKNKLEEIGNNIYNNVKTNYN